MFICIEQIKWSCFTFNIQYVLSTVAFNVILLCLNTTGYTVWSHNLVAISRLRGSSLKVLAVSEESIDFDPDQRVFMEGDPVHNLVKEVSLGLGRVWHPSMDSNLVLSEPTQHFHREMQSFSLGM